MKDNILKHLIKSVPYANNHSTLEWHYGDTKSAAITAIVQISDLTNNTNVYFFNIY